jgi:hypothetical protein
MRQAIRSRKIAERAQEKPSSSMPLRHPTSSISNANQQRMIDHAGTGGSGVKVRVTIDIQSTGAAGLLGADGIAAGTWLTGALLEGVTPATWTGATEAPSASRTSSAIASVPTRTPALTSPRLK